MAPFHPAMRFSPSAVVLVVPEPWPVQAQRSLERVVETIWPR